MAPDREIQKKGLGGYRYGVDGGRKRDSRKPRLSARSMALSSPTASIALDLGIGGRAPPHNGGSRGVRGHADREIAFSVSRTVAFVVGLREDGRKAVRQQVAMFSPLRCVLRCAFKGASLVRRVDPGPNRRTHWLQLTGAAAAHFGVSAVLQRSKVLSQASAVFGCAMTHRSVLQQAAASNGPGDFVWVFEDDAYCPTDPDDITSCLEGLLGSALQRGHLVDIVYCGQNSAHTTGKVLACERGCAPLKKCKCSGRRLVQTKSSYGSFSYLVRRSRATYVCDYLDPAGEVLTSDGAMLHSYTMGPLLAAHFEFSRRPYNLVGHRPPSETGGSRIR